MNEAEGKSELDLFVKECQLMASRVENRQPELLILADPMSRTVN